LRWLLGFAQEPAAPRTLAERRTVHAQVGAYLGGLLLRQKGEEDNGPLVMELGDPRMSGELPMRGVDNQKPLDEKLELIRTGVRRILKAFLSTPTVARRVTGEIAWQRILDNAPGRRPTFRVQGVAADVREGITFCLLEDLAQAGALVRECPAQGCGKVFVRRFRQDFCSTACRNRTNFQKWYRGTRTKTAATPVTPDATARKRSTRKPRVRTKGKPKRRAKKT
jgi:endogenous inhibitor of DNA gyrase (YacG/DUF329 family)